MKKFSLAVALLLLGCSPKVADPDNSAAARLLVGAIQNQGGGGQGQGGVAQGGGDGGRAQGGSAPTTSGTGQGGAGVPIACGDAVQFGDVDYCRGDHGPSCGDAALCDEAGNRFKVDCTSEGCKCLYNGVEACACTFPAPVCFNEDPSSCCASLNDAGCCPAPWFNSPTCSRDACSKNSDCCTNFCFEGACQP